jgi:hypothetical protein
METEPYDESRISAASRFVWDDEVISNERNAHQKKPERS